MPIENLLGAATPIPPMQFTKEHIGMRADCGSFGKGTITVVDDSNIPVGVMLDSMKHVLEVQPLKLYPDVWYYGDGHCCVGMSHSLRPLGVK